MKRSLTTAAALGAAAATGAFFLPIGLADAGHTNAVLSADLDGRSEVASDASNNRIAGDPSGRGEAYVFGVDGDAATLCYVLVVDKIDPATAAHIHEGSEGANGPVVANLAAPGDGDAADCLTEGEAGKFPTGESGIVQRILENPEDFYVNVHNPTYPGGAIRGQLAPG